MFRFSNTYINLVSLILSIFIFSIINLIYSNFSQLSHIGVMKASFNVEESIPTETNEYNVVSSNDLESENWYLEIPVIEVKNSIKEGTSSEILDDYIGHFEETSKEKGNIGLAAHNRGYKNNYFKDLKKLKEGDLIYYNYKNTESEYVVIKNEIIEDTDWEPLKQTEEDIITLITCVENQKQYRRCVQAIKK